MVFVENVVIIIMLDVIIESSVLIDLGFILGICLVNEVLFVILVMNIVKIESK